MLTDSLSWGLESPFLFDHFEVATWGGRDLQRASGAKAVAFRLHRQQSDGTMNKLNLILIFLEYKRPLDGGFCLGSASGLGQI